jgi:hypothetical protein
MAPPQRSVSWRESTFKLLRISIYTHTHKYTTVLVLYYSENFKVLSLKQQPTLLLKNSKITIWVNIYWALQMFWVMLPAKLQTITE